MAVSELTRAKTILVLAIVVGCFAVLWPKVFYPMFQGGVAPEPPPHHKDDAICCGVVFEMDSYLQLVCTHVLHKDLRFARGSAAKQALQECRENLLTNCLVDIRAPGYRPSQNLTLCLRDIYGVDEQKLHHRPNGTVSNPRHMRPERPAHLHPDVLHPGLREKGRTMPPSHADAKQGRPPLGVRPPMGAGAHVGNTQKGVGAGGGGAMSIVMPIYTIGIVVFFVYTVMKVLFKKQPESSEEPQIKDFGMDPEHRKFLYEKVGDENVEFSSRSADDMQQRSRVSAAEPIIDPVVISTDKKDATISAPIPAPEEVGEVKQDQIIVDVQKQDKPVAFSLVAIRDQKEEVVSKVSVSEEASALLISKDDHIATIIAPLDKEQIQEAVVQPIESIIAPASTIFIQGEKDVKAETELLPVEIQDLLVLDSPVPDTDAEVVEPLGSNVKEEVATVQKNRGSPGDEAVKAEEPTKAFEGSAETIPLVEGQVGVVSVDQEPSDVTSAFVVKEEASPSSEETIKDEEPAKVVEETADAAITSALDVTEEVAPVQAREDSLNEETVRDEEPAKVVEETADSSITSALNVSEEVAPVQAREDTSNEEAFKVEEPAKANEESAETVPHVEGQFGIVSVDPDLSDIGSALNVKVDVSPVQAQEETSSEDGKPQETADSAITSALDVTEEVAPVQAPEETSTEQAVEVEEPAKAVAEPTEPSVLESAEPALVQDDSASNERSLSELEVVELPKLDITSDNVIPSQPKAVDLVVSDASTEILPTVETSSPDVSIAVSNVINETLQDTDTPSPVEVCDEKSNEDTESVTAQSETEVLPSVSKSTDPGTKQQESSSITVCDDLEITLTKSEDIRPTDPNTQENAPIQEEQFSKPDDVEQVSIASEPAEVAGDVESVTKPIVVASEVDEPQKQETSYIPRDDVGSESLKDADSPAVEIVPIATDASCDPTVLEPSALSSDSIVSEPAESSLEPEKPEPSLLDPTFKDESVSAEELKQPANDDVLIISDPDKESSDVGGIDLGCDGITEVTENIPLPESLGVDIDDDRLLEIESMIESDLSIFLDAPNIPITEVIAKPVTYARVSSRAVSVEDDEAEDVIEKVTIKPYVKSDAPEESGSHENVEDLIKQAITDEDVVVDLDSTPTSKSNDIQIDGNITVAPDTVVDVVFTSAGEKCTVETPDSESLVINETSVCPLTFAVVEHTEANELGTDSVAAQEEVLDHQSPVEKGGNVDPTTAVELSEKETTSELKIVVEPEVLPTVASVVVSSVISDPSPQLSVDNMEDVVEKDIMLEIESLVQPQVLEVVQAAVESLTESSTAPAVSEAAAMEVVDSTVVESPSINEPSEQLVEKTADADVIATEAEAVKEETTSKVESSVERESLEAVEPVASEAAGIDSIENEKFPVEFEFEEEKTHGTDSNQSAEVVTNICDTVEVPQSCPEFSPLTTETSNTPEVFTALGAASEEINQRESVGESSVKIGECCAGACLQEINLPKAAFVECPVVSTEKTIENKLEDLRKQKELEMDLLRRRLEETEAAMERIVAQMGTASDKLLTRDQYDRDLSDTRKRLKEAEAHLERIKAARSSEDLSELISAVSECDALDMTLIPEQLDDLAEIASPEIAPIQESLPFGMDAVATSETKISVIGMEVTAQSMDGSKMARPATPTRPATPKLTEQGEVVSVFLDALVPTDSHLLVSEAECRAEAVSLEQLDLDDSEYEAAPVVLSGKMTLSVMGMELLADYQPEVEENDVTEADDCTMPSEAVEGKEGSVEPEIDLESHEEMFTAKSEQTEPEQLPRITKVRFDDCPQELIIESYDDYDSNNESIEQNAGDITIGEEEAEGNSRFQSAVIDRAIDRAFESDGEKKKDHPTKDELKQALSDVKKELAAKRGTPPRADSVDEIMRQVDEARRPRKPILSESVSVDEVLQSARPIENCPTATMRNLYISEQASASVKPASYEVEPVSEHEEMTSDIIVSASVQPECEGFIDASSLHVEPELDASEQRKAVDEIVEVADAMTVSSSVTSDCGSFEHVEPVNELADTTAIETIEAIAASNNDLKEASEQLESEKRLAVCEAEKELNDSENSDSQQEVVAQNLENTPSTAAVVAEAIPENSEVRNPDESSETPIYSKDIAQTENSVVVSDCKEVVTSEATPEIPVASTVGPEAIKNAVEALSVPAENIPTLVLSTATDELSSGESTVEDLEQKVSVSTKFLTNLRQDSLPDSSADRLKSSSFGRSMEITELVIKGPKIEEVEEEQDDELVENEEETGIEEEVPQRTRVSSQDIKPETKQVVLSTRSNEGPELQAEIENAMKEESLPTSKGSSPDMEEYEVVKSDVLTSRLEPISSEEGNILADDKPITEECIRSSSESSSCEMLNKSGRDHSPSPSTETTSVPVSDVISDKRE